ncbi:hypothetical protein, partial [Brucella melitensis]|uniref:hypothetical protein n=1 Tax=Brucella melitensis TaxID=29459 RepID=UPI001FD06C08
KAIELARVSDRPTLIACKTTIGFGAPNKAGTNKVHGSPLGAEGSSPRMRRSNSARVSASTAERRFSHSRRFLAALRPATRQAS